MSAGETSNPSLRKRFVGVLLLVLLFTTSAAWLSVEIFFLAKTKIGATADVTELSSGITCKARVDTGAAVSSVHCDQLTITDESDDPLENIGKSVHFLLANDRGEQSWIDTQIFDYAVIKSIDAVNHRYYVRLRLSCAGVERETLVTLADRAHMKYECC